MNFKKILPHLIAIVVFYAVALFFFTPQFQGKSLSKGDVLASVGSGQESREFRKSGETILWNNSLFGGMPNYQVSPPPGGNYLPYARGPLSGYLGRPAGLIFLGMLSCYLFLVLAGVNPWLGITGALAAGLATNGFILIKAGQMAKITTVVLVPLTAAGIVLAYRKKYIWGALVFALGMGLTLAAKHPQMLYYYGLTLPFYGIGRFLYDYRKGQVAHFLKAAGVLVAGLLLALAANATFLLTTLEYTPQTMRGGQILEQPVRTSKTTPSAKSDGLEWDYAMQWSNGLIDLVASYSPMAAGGGNGTKVESSSPLGKAMSNKGYRMPKEFGAPTYFGALPFTEGPIYAGAVVWALFLFGLFTAPARFRLWMGGGMLFLFALSMGKEFESLNYFLHNHFPLMKSFRAHNSALSLSTVLMVSLGIFGIHNWLKTIATDTEKARRQLMYAGGAAVALGVLVAVVIPLGLDYNGADDARLLARSYGIDAQVANDLSSALVDTRAELYASSAWRSFLFLGLSFGVLFLVFRQTISPTIAAALLAALIVVDFSGINDRYLSKEDWKLVPARTKDFPITAADQAILQDTDPNYRVFNTTVSTFNDASTSYHHHSLGGYNAVKMRRIQDVIDAFFLPRDENKYTYNYPRRNDQQLLDMLNVRYFIVNGQEGPRAQRNPNAFGDAWLVNNIEFVDEGNEEFEKLATLPDLKNTAIVPRTYKDAVGDLRPTGQGSVQLTEFNPDRMTYSFESDADQLVVFSETYYGPDLGWTATIDGNPAPIVRANYLLRAIPVPAGKHEIVMTFKPTIFYTGRTLSQISSILILLGLVGYGAYTLYRRREEQEEGTTA